MEITVLHTTPQYLVCLKPSGVESEKQLPRLLCEQTGEEILYPVHRLDKETAGVMVFAKTKSAAAYFSREIQENRFEKTYLAVVKGTLEEKESTFTDLLFRDKQKNKSYVVKRMRKGVKEAVLSYCVLKEIAVEETPNTLVEVHLQTGRTHQIRVQFASRKHPLLGDKKYGGQSYSHLCLLAKQLTFVTPQGETVTFTANQELL